MRRSKIGTSSTSDRSAGPVCDRRSSESWTVGVVGFPRAAIANASHERSASCVLMEFSWEARDKCAILFTRESLITFF